MRATRRISALGAVVLSLSVLGQGVALADGGIGPACGDVFSRDTVGGGVSATEEAQSDAKSAIAAEYVRVKQSGESTDRLAQLTADYSGRYGHRAQLVPSQGGGSVLSLLSPGQPSQVLAVTASAWGQELAVSHFGQQQDYYCGPASGQTVLGYWRKPSAYNGAALSQTNLASSAHMATDANQVTAWASHRWRIGVNRWRQGSDTGYYVDSPTPSASEFKNSLLYDIDNFYPFGADTVEIANGDHYNNHPKGRTIGHWLAVYGYQNYGDTVMLIDPATTVWSGLQPRFTASTSGFAGSYLQSNGITW